MITNHLSKYYMHTLNILPPCGAWMDGCAIVKKEVPLRWHDHGGGCSVDIKTVRIVSPSKRYEKSRGTPIFFPFGTCIVASPIHMRKKQNPIYFAESLQ